MRAEDDLPSDLREAVAAIAERVNVCRLVSLADLDDVLPARRLSRGEAERLVAALSEAGLHVVEPDAALRLADPP